MAARKTKNPCLVWTRKTVQDRCEEDGDCLIWREGVTASGCPQARINGSSTKNVRNFVFVELMGKALPRGNVIQPKCGNPRCLADECLARITVSTWRARVAKARAATPLGRREMQRRAQAGGLSKLNEELAAEIRRSEKSAREWAQKLGVNVRTIHKVRAKKAWAPLTVVNSVFSLGG